MKFDSVECRNECLRRAIAVVTAGLEDGADAMIATAHGYMEEDDLAEFAEIAGLHSLVRILLIWLQESSGRTAAEILQDIDKLTM